MGKIRNQSLNGRPVLLNPFSFPVIFFLNPEKSVPDHIFCLFSVGSGQNLLSFQYLLLKPLHCLVQPEIPSSKKENTKKHCQQEYHHHNHHFHFTHLSISCHRYPWP